MHTPRLSLAVALIAASLALGGCNQGGTPAPKGASSGAPAPTQDTTPSEAAPGAPGGAATTGADPSTSPPPGEAPGAPQDALAEGVEPGVPAKAGEPPAPPTGDPAAEEGATPEAPTPPADAQSDGFPPPTSEQQALIDAATKALRDENVEAAITAFEALMKTEPMSGLKMTGAIALSDFYLQGGESTKAVALLEEATARAPKTGEAQFVLARAYKAAGRARDAIAAYEGALAVEPLLLRAHVEIGGLRAELGEEDAARAAMLSYERAIYRYAKLLEAEDTHPSDKFKIIEAFSLLPDDRVANSLVIALSDPFRLTRLAAAEALGEVGTREVLPALEKALASAREVDDQHMMGLVEQAIERVKDTEPSDSGKVGPTFTEPGEEPTVKPPVEVERAPAKEEAKEPGGATPKAP